MQMKSLLALSVLVSAAFLTNVGNAADATAPDAAADTTTAVVDQPADDNAAPVKSATKKKRKRAHKKHKHHHAHGRDLEQRLAPHWIWSDNLAQTNNFLIGGSLSYVVRDTKFITRYTAPNLTPAVGIYTDHNEKLVDNGVMPGLMAGWQWRCNRVMLGVEANVDFDSFEKSEEFAYTEIITGAHAVDGTMLYNRGDIYTLSGRAGYFVTPFFMPYLRAGAQVSRDEANYQAFVSNLGTRLPDFSSEKKDVWGFVVGIGAEFPTYIGGSTIRFEYNFVRTESIIIGDGQFPIIGEHKFRYPESNIGRMTWVWNFL